MRLSDSQLAVLLMESERFDEIIRDDEFWRALESISPDAQEIAVRDRFMALVADKKSELQIESYAKLAANVVETVRRWGPAEARKKLRPTSH